jgi:UPF0176 protein
VSDILNIAAYRFVALDDLAELREKIAAQLAQLALKGTVLLAPEGINLFLAGAPDAVDQFLLFLRADPRFGPLQEKRSYSASQPFKRTRVKLKREIVPLGVHNLNPADYPAPYLSAETLKAWIDEGRSFVLLDTRNRFEFERGTFHGAHELGINDFRSFPDAVKPMLEQWRQTPVVTFCTGGIRCEKAAPLMQKLGFAEVYQLDGGILKYFETQGGAHFSGECFVFDERITLDETLAARA